MTPRAVVARGMGCSESGWHWWDLNFPCKQPVGPFLSKEAAEAGARDSGFEVVAVCSDGSVEVVHEEPEVDEKERLRAVVDELADELADLVIAFDDVKRDIGELAERHSRWANLQRLLWPEG